METSISRRAVAGSSTGIGTMLETRSRGYQLGILRETLERNMIILIDTVSEKAYIAILRIGTGLEKEKHKLHFLLVAHVFFGRKQSEVLNTSLPPVDIQSLGSHSTFERWNGQEIWGSILTLDEGASRVAISTYQVLPDALTHGFARAQGIRVLVFGEAHASFVKNPGDSIMQGFFSLGQRREELFVIPGLSGRSVLRAKSLQRITEPGLSTILQILSPSHERLLGYLQQAGMGEYISPYNRLRYETTFLVPLTDIRIPNVEEMERGFPGTFPTMNIGTTSVFNGPIRTTNIRDLSESREEYDSICSEENQVYISLYITQTATLGSVLIPCALGEEKGTGKEIEQREELGGGTAQENASEGGGLAGDQEQEDRSIDEKVALDDRKHRRIHIKSTGTLLTLESAMLHLQNFCASLPQEAYTDPGPIFTTTIDELTSSLYRAEVTLPNCIPLQVRYAAGQKAWRTRTWAKHDAAFEAYLGLYQLKEDPLLNNYLLPLWTYPASSPPRKAPKKLAKAVVDKTMDPWAKMRWEVETVIYATLITLNMPDESCSVEIYMLTPVECPPIDKVLVHWTKVVDYEIVVGESRLLEAHEAKVSSARKTTYRLLQTIFQSKMDKGVMDFPYLFIPKDQDQDWIIDDEGPMDALEAFTKYGPSKIVGILRDKTQNDSKYIIRRWRTDTSPLDHTEIAKKYENRSINLDQPLIEAVKLPERRDFLHEVLGEATPEATVLLLPQYCTVDKVPWCYSKLALLLPGVIHRIGMALIASDLQRTLLAPVGIKSIAKIITAISAPSARESTDYQRFEFLGDLVLKFLTSINLLDEHPHWHEGYLSRKKSKTVANSYLARAAQHKGLAKWIIADVFTGLKWKPRYIIPDGQTTTGNKELSTKTLADVVEALIGAAYLEGGYGMALKCIAIFELGISWKPLQDRIDSLASRATGPLPVDTPYQQGLEELLGYKFRHRALLLEAITHPCCESTQMSYGRLQFLGDALLDMVVVQELFFNPTLLSPVYMHLFKSSVVSGNFLAFLSLGYSIILGCPSTQALNDPTAPKVIAEEREANLWQFVGLPQADMASAKRELWDQYQGGMRDRIQTALGTCMYYPWTELSVFEADKKGKNKFLPDIVEAIMGAVFVDSGGDFGIVKALTERLGVLQWLRRFVKDKVNMIHPVTRLEETVAPMHKGKPRYVMSTENGEYVCTIFFHNEELAVTRSSSKAVSRAMAADMGLQKLEELGKKRVQEEEMGVGVIKGIC